MANNLDLMSIYGIPPAKYSEDNPDDLFLKNLPSLEQIAAYNLANQQLSNQRPVNTTQTDNQNMNSIDLPSTPATTIGNMPTDITGILMPQSNDNMNNMVMSMNNQTLMQEITDYSNPFPVTSESIQYMNGFIRTQIGRRVQIEFLIGNAELIEKDGYLLGVGSNYILMNEIGTNDITVCDFYNIKFIRFLY
ncbi:MAG: hypothetical protein E7566_00505 [Ruminococcaceae bacterium]|nr:hypothetical protein [Oscillospiraceae bacterium]